MTRRAAASSTRRRAAAPGPPRISSRLLAAALVIGALCADGPARLAGQGASAAERRAVDRAERLRDAGRADEARTVLSEHLGRAPGSLEALALMGELAVDGGDAPSVLPYAEAAVEALGGPTARGIWVEALIAAGLPDSALAVAERWRGASPEEPAAGLAVADARLARADTAGAIDALADGARASAAVGRRLADLLAARGDGEGAARAWEGLLAVDPPDVEAVVEDLATAGARAGDLLARLADRLREGAPARAGAIVALRVGRADEARALLERATTGVDPEDAALLREYARVADEAGLAGEVAWAAGELAARSPRPIDRLRWRALAAERALTAGDSGAARTDFRRLADESEAGEGAHEVATRRLFSLLAAEPADLDRARDLMAEYARQYPDSARARAAMRGELALGHARAGDVEAGEAILRAARGALPTEAWGALDGAGARLALFAGRRDSALARAGRAVLEAELEAGERTSRLALLTLAQSADSAEFAVAGRASLALLSDARAYDPGPVARELAGRPGGPGRPVVLMFVADRAHAAGRRDVAEGLRRRVVEAFPASAEAPAALLELARAAPPDEAALWLERLVVTYPESALAPMARRLLSELEPG